MTNEQSPNTDELNAIFAAACEDQQNGRLEKAEAGYIQLLKLFSDAPVLHYNLGLVYFEQGEFEKAIDAFEKGVAVAPEDVDLLFNLALCKRKSGDVEGAIEKYQLVLEKEPDSVDTLYNLGGCYREKKEYKAAIDLYEKTLQLSPDHTAAHNNIAYLFQVIDDTEKAIFHYKKVVEKKPDHEAAAHMLAALTGGSVSSTPDGYITEVFDNYSGRYEASLVEELEYKVPQKILAIVAAKDLWKHRFHRGLDLGCGTGLSGEPFIEIVDMLDGVDLSPKMVEQARLKGIYRSLSAGSIGDFLMNSVESYDFFLAADVFAYLGELEETLQLLKKHAEPDALLCFSTELHNGAGFTLRQTGRFAHSKSYITSLAERTGWQLLHSEGTPLRKERGEWVQGELWFFGRETD